MRSDDEGHEQEELHIQEETKKSSFVTVQTKSSYSCERPSCQRLFIESPVSDIRDSSPNFEQLLSAIRRNDVRTVHKILENSLNLSGSLPEKLSEISDGGLKKSSHAILDQRKSLSPEKELPPIFANALYLAIEFGSFDVAQSLLEFGVDPNCPSHSCLESCGCSSYNSNSNRFVLPSSFNSPNSVKTYVNSRQCLDSFLRTLFVTPEGNNIFYDEHYTQERIYSLAPLFLAVAVGNATMVHLLLQYGASPKIKDRHGVTPLHIAACQNKVSWSCIRLLLERGAQIQVTNNHGVTPAQILNPDLSLLQKSLIEDAFSCFLAHPVSRVEGEESFLSTGNTFRNHFLLKRFQDNKSNCSRQITKDEDSHSSVQRNSIETSSHTEEEFSETIECVDQRRRSNTKFKTKGHTSNGSCEARITQAKVNLEVLTKMATNIECLPTLISNFQLHLPSIIELADNVAGHSLEKPLSVFLEQLVQTTHQSIKASKKAHILCMLLRVSIGCLRGAQSLQFSGLLVMNKLIDICVEYKLPLGNDTQDSSIEELQIDGVDKVLSGSCVTLLLNTLNNGITLHKRQKRNCSPYKRSRPCHYHCLQILSGRALLYCCHLDSVQKKLMEEANLKILVSATEATLDPELLCLSLQAVAILCMNPAFHKDLLESDLIENLTQLILPSDQWFHEGQPFLYARYVKHHATRILVYLDQDSHIRNNLFEILENEVKDPGPDIEYIQQTTIAKDTIYSTSLEHIVLRILKIKMPQKDSTDLDTEEGINFYLSALPLFVSPIILFRLLKHHFLTCLGRSSAAIQNLKGALTQKEIPFRRPSSRGKLLFSSLRRKESNYSDSGEADILAFQRELLNLPTYDTKPPVERPRSCSVPRVDNTHLLPSYNTVNSLFAQVRSSISQEEESILDLFLELAKYCKEELVSNAAGELRDFLNVLASLGDRYQKKARHLFSCFDLQVSEKEDLEAEEICEEYETLQRLVVSGDLPCSKEEATLLAGIQLRIEETSDQRLRTISEESGGNTDGERPKPKGTVWKDSDLDICVAPMYRSVKNMSKAIKDQRRKLFHSHIYENEFHLKKLYIQNCKRLPAYGCRVHQVKEKTKKKANRLLGIGVEKFVLLDSKSLLLSKSQFTRDLEQWRLGGGRSHDQILLEFRATKWSFTAASTSALRSISTELWEVMHDVDTRFLEDHVLIARCDIDSEIRKSVLKPQTDSYIVHKNELDCLQKILHFPEMVALQMSDVEYDMFYNVPPFHYVHQVTLPLCLNSSSENAVQKLVKRFQEVSSWITHMIVSQPTHNDRKAILSCILRVAATCWNLNNFNSAMEILAGLKSEKLKPFWLSLPEKENIKCLEKLSNVFLQRQISDEYQSALHNASSAGRIIPFFGAFLQDLRNILKGTPSLVVFSPSEPGKLSFISDFQGEDHFSSRIGVGGLINKDKIRKIHTVLEKIDTFHKFENEKRNSQNSEKDKDYESSICCEGDESFYEVSSNSFLTVCEDYLTILYHGCTVIHWDEDLSRSALVCLRLEKNNGTLTWAKPLWSSLRCSGVQDFNLVNLEYEPVSPGFLLRYETMDVVYNSIEEGFLDLFSVKEIHLIDRDVGDVSKRHGIPENIDKSCLRILHGNSLSDNRFLDFVAPSMVIQQCKERLNYIVRELKKQKALCDRRILWLKERYFHLYYAACRGPMPAEAIQVFGGRKWTLGSIDTLGQKRMVVNSGKLRKKKSQTTIRDFDLQSSITSSPKLKGSNEFSSMKQLRDNKDSPPLISSPAITHSSEMDLIQFVELFRSFMVRSRKDIHSLFEQIAASPKRLSDSNGSTYEKTPTSYLGLLTRNTPLDLKDSAQHKKDKKILDAIATASIVSNSAGVDTSKTLILDLDEFKQFLKDEQGERKSDEEVTFLIQRHEPDMELRRKNCLSFEGFARYLMDKSNFVFVPEHLEPDEDIMNEPLSHYFIASSHNTYLTGHQLKGESSVELYSQVLLTGCRCVELDCWDGDDGMPVIYHGHTLTTKIPFKNVVEAINKSAFVTSPYPIILSLENHCSLNQQAKMAHIFKTIFKDRLVTRFLFDTDYSDDPPLPSPNQLRYKVLIKNKKMHATITPAFSTRPRQPLKHKGGRTDSIISTASTGSFIDEDEDDDEEDDDDYEYILDENFQQQVHQNDKQICEKSAMTTQVKIRSAEDERSSHQISPELSDLVVYCQAIKFRGFVQDSSSSPTNSMKVKKMNSRKSLLSSSSLPGTPPLSSDLKTESCSLKKQTAPCHQVCSMNENKAKALCKRHPLMLITHCESHLMRTYPAGIRIDSSNFNPVVFWSFGIQMVALNYQTEDGCLHINTAMFEQNGSCGYVMKPRTLWDKSHMMYGRFNPWEKNFDGFHAINFSITIISGQYVCPNNFAGSPVVEMEITGIPADCNRFKTKLVQRNSLNPIWNEVLTFRVTFVELAFLRFVVMDMGSSHLTAQRVIPLSKLKQGYRHLRLRSPQNQPLPLSTLFIYSTWEEEGLQLPEQDDVVAGKNPQSKPGSLSVKRKMFFLVVFDVLPDEPNTILKITQESTTRDVILQALSKRNSTDSVDDFILIEEVQSGWEKKSTGKSRRILDLNERPLEAQAKWKGEGRFILKKLTDDPSTRAWMSTLRGTVVKGKVCSGSEIQGWTDGKEVFLVCIYNVAPDQPYAVLKAPVTSTAQDIIAQALMKARRIENPNQFVLLEVADCQGSQKQRRVLDDSENVFLVQQKWKSKEWFEMKEKEQLKHDKMIKKKSAFRKFRHSERATSTGSQSSWRQVHSEGEDDYRESKTVKLKRFSLKKLKTWR